MLALLGEGYSLPRPEQKGLHWEEVQFVAAGLPEANSK